MRHLAVVVATALVFALVAPAFAQPFADVPTNHWAYDAIAELAAKGLIEGYPDGTFKGDRAMTRYEMAMVVARLLARIESIQIPAPTPPQVTKADLDAIQRLVNEFRAELAALGVRVTAIEEELNAIKARLDNVRVTGGLRFRYDDANAATGASVNGNPRAKSGASSSQVPRARAEFKLGFDGSVAPDIHFIAGLESTGGYQIFNSSNFGAASANPAVSAAQGSFASIDSAFLDWRNAWGLPIEVWLGRFGTDSPCGGGCYPVQFGPFGLLMNDSGDTWEDTTFDSGLNVMDGLRVSGHIPAALDLQYQALIARVTGNVGGGSYFSGEDAYGGDVNVEIIKGLRIGGYYVGNNITDPSAFASPAPGIPGSAAGLWHLYGPGGGALNPSTGQCPAVAGAGIQCPAAGNGGGGYVEWDIIPGVHFDGEYASWYSSVFGTSDNGWQVNFNANLGQLLGIGHNLVLQAGYLDYGTNFYPPYGAAEADIAMGDALYPGNAQGFTAQVSFAPVQNWSIYGVYFGGNAISNGQSENEYEAGIVYNFTSAAKVTFKVRQLNINGVSQFLLYRAQVDYSF